MKGLEEAAARWWDKTLRHPKTLSGLGLWLDGVSAWKAGWDRALERTWSAWRLPSAYDVERLHERLKELEERLDDRRS